MLHIPGDFITKVKKVNSQSDLNLPHSQILCLHHFNLRSFYFKFLQFLPNWIQLHTSGTSAICTPFQRINNKKLSSLTAFYWASSSSSYFTVEKAAKTLHQMSPCTPVSVSSKITWLQSRAATFSG